jgi:hypothetical protein
MPYISFCVKKTEIDYEKLKAAFSHFTLPTPTSINAEIYTRVATEKYTITKDHQRKLLYHLNRQGKENIYISIRFARHHTN